MGKGLHGFQIFYNNHHQNSQKKTALRQLKIHLKFKDDKSRNLNAQQLSINADKYYRDTTRKSSKAFYKVFTPANVIVKDLLQAAGA